MKGILTFDIWIKLKNPLDHYFEFSKETKQDKLKKVAGHKEYKVNKQNYDDAFLLLSNNYNLLEEILTEAQQQLMLHIRTMGNCVWKFGQSNIAEKDRIISKSKYTDQEDILDFQLLKKDNFKDQTAFSTNWNPDNQSKLRLVVAVLPEHQSSATSIKNLLLDCFEQLTKLAEAIDFYHKINRE